MKVTVQQTFKTIQAFLDKLWHTKCMCERKWESISRHSHLYRTFNTSREHQFSDLYTVLERTVALAFGLWEFQRDILCLQRLSVLSKWRHRYVKGILRYLLLISMMIHSLLVVGWLSYFFPGYTIPARRVDRGQLKRSWSTRMI